MLRWGRRQQGFRLRCRSIDTKLLPTKTCRDAWMSALLTAPERLSEDTVVYVAQPE